MSTFRNRVLAAVGLLALTGKSSVNLGSVYGGVTGYFVTLP